MLNWPYHGYTQKEADHPFLKSNDTKPAENQACQVLTASGSLFMAGLHIEAENTRTLSDWPRCWSFSEKCGT